jgi:serine/threonine protein kinase
MLQALPDYKVLRQLSSGGMSSIFLANKRYSNHLCVIKTLATVESTDLEWRSNAARCLKHEYDLLRQLDHPDIVRVRYWVSGGPSEFMVLDYVPGQNLEQRLTHPDEQGDMQPGAKLPLAEALRYGSAVAGILDYLARQPSPIVHHDIKPSNLILHTETRRPVLVDFGSAVVLNDGTHAHNHLDSYGTPGYASPEQYNGEVSPRSDVYSLGATLYHLLTDDDPTKHPLAFPALTLLPPDVARMLQTALASDPQARPSARQFRAEIERVAAAHG